MRKQLTSRSLCINSTLCAIFSHIYGSSFGRGGRLYLILKGASIYPAGAYTLRLRSRYPLTVKWNRYFVIAKLSWMKYANNKSIRVLPLKWRGLDLIWHLRLPMVAAIFVTKNSSQPRWDRSLKYWSSRRQAEENLRFLRKDIFRHSPM